LGAPVASARRYYWDLYQQDQTADGRVIRLLNVVDESTREALSDAGEAQHRR